MGCAVGIPGQEDADASDADFVDHEARTWQLRTTIILPRAGEKQQEPPLSE